MGRLWTIAGGGIAGLSAAIALRQLGHEVTVFESYAELKPAGAGIILAPNALEALRRLHPQLPMQAMKLGRLTAEARILSERGTVLSSQSSGSTYGPMVALSRAELYTFLWEQLPYDTLQFGFKATGIRQDDASGKLELLLEDGSKRESEAILGCDGIHSAIRKQLVPEDCQRTRYAGYTCWRGISRVSLSQTFFSETWSPHGRFGIVPLSGGRVYWYALIRANERDPRLAGLNAADLAGLFSRFHAPIPAILASIEDHSIIHTDIIDTPPLPHFAYGRTLLLGDAAHAMTPNLGQGACQAIEDAAVLSECLRHHSDIQNAFQRYEQIRMPRVQRIAAHSYAVGRIAQLGSPWLCRMRDAAMRMTPGWASQRQLHNLYRMP